ncbi:MAG: SWIM zinc finger family protein [Ignavibacteria bacterium]|jgi:uncharacterized Zn finger protein
MTLKNFEDNISPVILERGYSYFVNNHITSLEEEDTGLWLAEVEGTDTYFVTIETESNKINNWDCDCPFEGEVCKHVAAVLYAIAESESLKKETVKSKGSKKKKTKNVEMIFNKVTKEDLKEFILSQFKKNRELKNRFIAYFAEHINENAEDKYKTIVKNVIKASEDSSGFIGYYSASSLTNDLEAILNKAQMLLEERNLVESLAICKSVIEELPSLEECMDDSDGGLYGLTEYAFDIFSQIAVKAPPELKDILFQYCIDSYTHGNFNGTDFSEEFLCVLPDLISLEEQEQQFFKIINDQIEMEKDEPYSDYRITRLIQIKVNFLKNSNRKEEAWKLVEDNKQYPEFMVLLVDEAVKRKDFIKAVELCFEGIKIAQEKRHPGTISDWNERLLTIYETTNNIVEIRKMAKKLFFEKHFSMKYYKKLRSTYKKEEWGKICESIIEKIKGKDKSGSYYDAHTLAEIFVIENYKERLLKLLQLNSKRIGFVDEYAKHIKKEYPEKLILLYEEGIKKHAENTGRNFYNEVAHYLKNLQKINGGKEKVKSIVNYFRQTYKNRRAMREILNKNFS